MSLLRLLVLPLFLIFFLVGCSEITLPTIPTTPNLVEYKLSLDTVDDLAEAGIITSTEKTRAEQHYVDIASQETGSVITLEQIKSTVPPELTPLQKFAGYLDFSNFMWGIAIISLTLAVLGFMKMFLEQILKLLQHLPIQFYEFLCFALSFFFIWWGLQIRTSVASEYIGILGCLVFAGALAMSAAIHKLEKNILQFSTILTIVWGVIALLYNGEMIGFLAIFALSGVIFQLKITALLSNALGYGEDSIHGQTTVSALFIFVFYLLINVLEQSVPILQVFEASTLIMGVAVGYTGLLGVTARDIPNTHGYWTRQLIGLGAAAAALSLGYILQIPDLLKVFGTFAVGYTLIKFWEIPAKGEFSQAAVRLVTGTLVLGFWWYVTANPDLTRPFFFLPN